jgi:hypothetical protein
MRRFTTLLVFVSALLNPAFPADVQGMTTPNVQNWTAEGVLSSSSRSFQASDERDGIFCLNFYVVAFDTDLQAEHGIHPFVSAALKFMHPREIFARPMGNQRLPTKERF